MSDADYYLEIEAHFAFRRETPFTFSSKDWFLMQSWRHDGIPLPIVLEAIDQSFDHHQSAGRRRTIAGLSFCRHAVKDLWSERKDLFVGGEHQLPETDPVPLLEALADRLLQSGEAQVAAISNVITAAADEVRAGAKGRSVPQIEALLLGIEQRMIEELLTLIPPELAGRLDLEVGRALAGFQGGNEVILHQTREANRLRLLRRELSLPRLSLFG